MKKKCPYCSAIVEPKYEYVYPEQVHETLCPECEETVSMMYLDPQPDDPDAIYEEDNWIDIG